MELNVCLENSKEWNDKTRKIFSILCNNKEIGIKEIRSEYIRIYDKKISITTIKNIVYLLIQINFIDIIRIELNGKKIYSVLDNIDKNFIDFMKKSTD